MGRQINRRCFLVQTGAMTAACLTHAGRSLGAAESPLPPKPDEALLAHLEAMRPSKSRSLPKDLRERVGASHVAGKYHLTKKPFLLEGGEKLIEMGSLCGKFWFTPSGIAGSYPFNSQWGKYAGFVELAKSDYFQQLFNLPYRTIVLEAHTPVEDGWKKSGLSDSFYQRVTQEFHDLTAHLYKTYHDRALTFVLQHWEGDWLLRGRGGEKWDPPPSDWKQRCENMALWLKARQAGVTQARKAYGQKARCTVAHATEVNRVADIWKNIPTMTEHVLPGVELDLISYSAYDGLKDAPTLWLCLEEIRKRSKTGSLYGPGTIFVGEFGIPENEQPKDIQERYDIWMGVMLAAKVKYMIHWELYCNELNPKIEKPPVPITDETHARGFWLVKPDGSLSEGGKYFMDLWKRTRTEASAQSPPN